MSRTGSGLAAAIAGVLGVLALHRRWTRKRMSADPFGDQVVDDDGPST